MMKKKMNVDDYISMCHLESTSMNMRFAKGSIDDAIESGTRHHDPRIDVAVLGYCCRTEVQTLRVSHGMTCFDCRFNGAARDAEHSRQRSAHSALTHARNGAHIRQQVHIHIHCPRKCTLGPMCSL